MSIDFTNNITNFANIAVEIRSLNLVISVVDNVVAHLTRVLSKSTGVSTSFDLDRRRIIHRGRNHWR